jgi:hypothetical protein
VSLGCCLLTLGCDENGQEVSGWTWWTGSRNISVRRSNTEGGMLGDRTRGAGTVLQACRRGLLLASLTRCRGDHHNQRALTRPRHAAGTAKPQAPQHWLVGQQEVQLACMAHAGAALEVHQPRPVL